MHTAHQVEHNLDPMVQFSVKDGAWAEGTTSFTEFGPEYYKQQVWYGCPNKTEVREASGAAAHVDPRTGQAYAVAKCQTVGVCAGKK